MGAAENMTVNTTTELGPPVIKKGIAGLAYRWLLPLVPFAALLLGWVLYVEIAEPVPGIFPSPSLVWDAVTQALESGELWDNVSASLRRVFLGFVTAAVSGITLGILVGLSKRVSEFLSPLVTFLSSLSGIVWIPLAIAWFGFGTGMVVFIIWNAAFFLIFGNVILGVRLVPKSYENGLMTLGASRSEVIRQVIIPGAMPFIMSGLRSGLGFGWRGLVAAELVGATNGLGRWIFDAIDFTRADIIVAGALLIGVMGWSTDRYLLAPLERRTIERWGTVSAK
jgi:NitT/TauT family transport system permease protein/taurine transport system permease protein